MKNIIIRELKANLKSLFFGSLGAFGMTAIGFMEYTAVSETEGSMQQIFDMLPRVARVMFGAGRLPIDTPQGYYACMLLWLSLITFAHAALLGGGILSKEERDKTAEFLYTKPINRSRIITAKAAASLINIIVINLVCCVTTLGCFLPLVKGVDMKNDVGLTMLGMLLGQVLMFFIGLCISALVKSHKKAISYSAYAVIGLYFAGVLMELAEIDALNFITPFRSFHSVEIMENGFSAWYSGITAVIIGLCVLITYRLYGRRNLHI